jgi:hypothetical protein
MHVIYQMFTAPGTVVRDDGNGKDYQNLLDALVDTMYSALESAGARSVPVVVSESGWHRLATRMRPWATRRPTT